MNAAFSEIYAETSCSELSDDRQRVRCALRSWYDADGIQNLCASLYGASDGAHGTASEVAVTQFRYPDHIKKYLLDPLVAPEFANGVHDAFDLRKRYPDGRIGSNPALATPEHGKILAETAIASLATDFLAFVNDANAL